MITDSLYCIFFFVEGTLIKLGFRIVQVNLRERKIPEFNLQASKLDYTTAARS